MYTPMESHCRIKTHIVEAQGVPLGYKTRQTLEAISKSFGMICRVISDGLVEGDPNIVLVEAEGPMGSTPLATIKRRGLQGTFGIRQSTPLPPPPLATRSKLAAAEDDRENDIVLSEAAIAEDESGKQQTQRTSPTK